MKCSGTMLSIQPHLDECGVFACSRCGALPRMYGITSLPDNHELKEKSSKLLSVNDKDKKERLFNQLTALKSLMVFDENTDHGCYCIDAAIIVNYIFDGKIYSVSINHNHYFNVIGNTYVDISGSEIAVQDFTINKFHVRERFSNDIKDEVLERVQKLVQRSLRGIL